MREVDEHYTSKPWWWWIAVPLAWVIGWFGFWQLVRAVSWWLTGGPDWSKP